MNHISLFKELSNRNGTVPVTLHQIRLLLNDDTAMGSLERLYCN